MSTRCPAQVKRTAVTARERTAARRTLGAVRRPVEPQTAVITGATGQDGYYLVRRLLAEGRTVHAAVRDVERAERLFDHHPRLRAVRRDLRDPGPLCALVGDV